MPPPESSEPGRPPCLSSTTTPDLTDRIIRPDDQYYEAGGFGDVFRCRYTSDGGIKQVAVKAFRFNFTVDEHKCDGVKAARMIRRELGIWSRLNHRNVVPFLGIVYGFGKQGSASLVSMWMPHGTLHSFLQAHDNQLAVAHRLQLLLDIANGLHYLHSFPMVHGDLSSNNVLLDHDYNACLTDFGCASLIGELPDGFAYLQTSTVRPGTLRWAAPEHFSPNEEEPVHNPKSDIYSFGNMALLVLSGKYPWCEIRSDAAVMLRLSQGLKPERPLARPIDDQHWALIERCWSLASERPLAAEVVSSLQQLLGVYPPPPPLRDPLDVSTPSFNVPDRPSNADLDNDVTQIESSLGPRSRIPTGTSASASPLVPEDITRWPGPSTSSPDQIHEPPSSEREDIEKQSVTKDLGEDVRIHGLVASGLPTYLNEEQAQKAFQNFGELKRFHLVREDGNGLSKGIAFFEYVDASVTDVAVQGLNGMKLGDSYIVVQREGTTSDADESHRPPLTEWKTMSQAKDKKPTRVGKDDSQKQPEHARAGYSYRNPSGLDLEKRPERAKAGHSSIGAGGGYSHGNPSGPDSKKQPWRGRGGHPYTGRARAGPPSGTSTRPKPGPRAEDTVSQNKQTTSEHVPHPPPDGPRTLSKWVRGVLLGAGTYGRVYLALDSSTGEMIAVKQVKKDNKVAQLLNFVPELKTEREILSRLDHPHIVGYLGSEETTTFLNILLEYIPGGSIASCLREHGRFDEEVVKSFTAQIFDGLAYLHANHIIHRNIEANNILVEPSGICKISGFGNAQRTDDDSASWTPMRGIVPWTAPELVRSHGGKRYGPKVDIWSVGCVLLNMWMGGKPSLHGYKFALTVEAMRRGTSAALPLDVILSLSDLAIDFRNRCFAIDPGARASATELMEHPYLILPPNWVFTGFKHEEGLLRVLSSLAR